MREVLWAKPVGGISRRASRPAHPGTPPARALPVRRFSIAVLLAFGLAAACGAPAGPGAESPTPTGSGTATPTPGVTPTPTPVTGPGHLRLMAANLTSGTQQSWTPGHGMRILGGAHPDVVMLQEFNYKTNSDLDLREFVDTTFGPGWYAARQTGVQIPNGIVSRYPILESGTWIDTSVSNRGFTWAHIDVPGDVDLWAVSVHFLTSNASDRNVEAQQLVAKIGSVVPTGAFVAIGGDLNTGNRTETCITSLSSVVSTTAPFPADKNGNTYTSAARSTPHDWVLVSAGLRALEGATVIGGNTFANGLVVDTRVYDPIADLSPAQATDSGASGMQHMGVVRDFDLP